MKIQFITLFPEMFDGALSSSILNRAAEKQLVQYSFINLREFGLGKYKQVDDTPYGGGAGMVLRPEPLVNAIEHAKKIDSKAKVILPTPRGQQYTQAEANSLASESGLIILCPRYEGYDERIVNWVDHSISIGDYVLSGGEIPAMVITDSVVRLIPGVLGNDQSIKQESFQINKDVKEFPHYTRPEDFRGQKVPEVLISGNHKNISDWRQQNTS